jgi:hypothetical protein
MGCAAGAAGAIASTTVEDGPCGARGLALLAERFPNIVVPVLPGLERAIGARACNCQPKAFSSVADAGSHEEPKVREANTRQNKNLDSRSDPVGSGI